ncbi:MAG: cytochrome c maturation protein CcmE [Alphaproteobacteria bacterium]|nr:cytochrome c maturation protein CcmE [Alphaproteobacteria bacterium]
MTRKHKRLGIIAGLGVVLAIAAGLILYALNDQIVFFYSPADLREKNVAIGQPIRVGGLVETGSWLREGEHNSFVISDGAEVTKVTYTGILPDLFREGQGVIAEGALLADGSFAATSVLAKHDENYMPKEVADAIKARGEWRDPVEN